MAETTTAYGMAEATSKLGSISFGLAIGIVVALGMFILGMMSAMTGWGIALVKVLSSLYIGYSPTLVGSIAGAVWGFVDGFLGGALVAWLYNKLLPVCRSR